MTLPESAPASRPSGEKPSFQSLRELVDAVTGRDVAGGPRAEEAGLAEVLPFPFLALVGQEDMKLALLLAVINPLVGGVLLVGPRGTGKTTAVRSLIDLLPYERRSACYYGCVPEDIEAGGLDAVCPDCARKYGEGNPLTRVDRARLIELPLNAGLVDVIGGWDELAAASGQRRMHSGILKQADQNVLYIDEVNLLGDEIINAILDAAALGIYTVRRGTLASTYRARFTLIGSMNPEEGRLRPQILDRFGLRIIVHGLTGLQDRLHAYHRSRTYRRSPHHILEQYAVETAEARDEIQAARERLSQVSIPPRLEVLAVRLVQRLEIDSLRADITLLEAARALSAAESRSQVMLQDLKTVAPMALRMRQSPFMLKYFQEQGETEKQLKSFVDALSDEETG